MKKHEKGTPQTLKQIKQHHNNSIEFQEEQSINPDTDSTFTEFAEIISYSYKTILNCFKHFETRYGLELIDSNDLATYYKNAGH